MVEPIIIIGTGLAAYTLAREFRALDKNAPLMLISADDGAFYSKPMLSTALAKKQTPDNLLNATAAAMSERLDAEILIETSVVSIKASKKEIITNHGNFNYSKLVIATGALPVRFPVAGDADDSDILSVNNRQDYAVFRQTLDQISAAKVAIIGPGLIGCEFANDLLASNHSVTLIGPDPYPISTLLPEAVGAALQNKMSDAGAQWQLGRTLKQLDKRETGFQLTLDDGNTLEADIILSAIGLRSDVRLAKEADLEFSAGIKTNKYLQTSDDHIYALGDCAEVDGRVLPFVMPIMQGAKVLAKTLSGDSTKVNYPAMPIVIKTPLYPLCVLPPSSEGTWLIEQDEEGILARYLNSDRQLQGFALSAEKIKQRQALVKKLQN